MIFSFMGYFHEINRVIFLEQLAKDSRSKHSKMCHDYKSEIQLHSFCLFKMFMIKMILIKNFPSGRVLNMIALNYRTHRKLKSLHKTFTAGKHFIIFFWFFQPISPPSVGRTSEKSFLVVVTRVHKPERNTKSPTANLVTEECKQGDLGKPLHMKKESQELGLLVLALLQVRLWKRNR